MKIPHPDEQRLSRPRFQLAWVLEVIATPDTVGRRNPPGSRRAPHRPHRPGVRGSVRSRRKTLASGGDLTLRLWDVGTRQQLGDPLTGEIATLAFSPDGHMLASGSRNDDRNVRLWDVDTLQQLGTPSSATPSARSTPSPSAPTDTPFATASIDRTTRLWDITIPTDFAVTVCAAAVSPTKNGPATCQPGQKYRTICPG
ncbi:WD40 repeat domain-containing protein [Nonomuraea endophytica]|uniref:WD40 repeat domain-containing protein n=1 Tax=Nonomuraea endophytica TaxID=714136 RepID=UPI0037C72EC7